MTLIFDWHPTTKYEIKNENYTSIWRDGRTVMWQDIFRIGIKVYSSYEKSMNEIYYLRISLTSYKIATQ